jgi:hypothetical protein
MVLIDLLVELDILPSADWWNMGLFEKWQYIPQSLITGKPQIWEHPA